MSLKTMMACLAVTSAICTLIAEAADDLADEISPSRKQMEMLQTDPTLKAANASFESEMRVAENTFTNNKRKLEARRLSIYQDQLKNFTKAGDFDRAVACKAAIEHLGGTGLTPKENRPKDSVRYDGHEYALIKEAVTWHVAKRRCEMVGGHLAFVKNKKDLSVIIRLAGHHDVWLGASDEEKEGEWKWTDGTRWVPFNNNFDNFHEVQHHLMFVGRNGTFDDGNAGVRVFYICEWDN